MVLFVFVGICFTYNSKDRSHKDEMTPTIKYANKFLTMTKQRYAEDLQETNFYEKLEINPFMYLPTYHKLL